LLTVLLVNYFILVILVRTGPLKHRFPTPGSVGQGEEWLTFRYVQCYSDCHNLMGFTMAKRCQILFLIMFGIKVFLEIKPFLSRISLLSEGPILDIFPDTLYEVQNAYISTSLSILIAAKYDIVS
jgi:hypothetical protein